MLRFFGEKRRPKLREQPFPDQWTVWLGENFAVYPRLPDEDRRELHGHIHVFLDEKTIEGHGGLEMNDEIRVTIAAQACLLLLHRDTDYYPSLHSILVYPTEYIAPEVEVDDAGVVTEFVDTRSGETWKQGSLVLAWDEVLEGGRDLEDSFNVVIHEFTHQLDLENGDFDGIPRLESKDRHASWARVLGEAFDQLRHDAKRRRPTLIDPYGVEDPSEFFAVAVECFFEDPVLFKQTHPALYDELSNYFQQDPAAW